MLVYCEAGRPIILPACLICVNSATHVLRINSWWQRKQENEMCNNQKRPQDLQEVIWICVNKRSCMNHPSTHKYTLLTVSKGCVKVKSTFKRDWGLAYCSALCCDNLRSSLWDLVASSDQVAGCIQMNIPPFPQLFLEQYMREPSVALKLLKQNV